MVQNEITIDVNGFKKVLDQLRGAVPSRATMPILTCVKLCYEADTDMFKLTASNGDLWLTVQCATKEGDELKKCVHLLREDSKKHWQDVCLPYADLRNCFALLPAARRCTVALTTKGEAENEQMACTIDYQDGKLQLPFYSGIDFPEAPAVATEGDNAVCQFTVDADTLLNPVNQARVCVAENDLRPAMSAVCLTCSIDTVVVAASDGAKLFKQVIETPGYMQKMNFAADGSANLLIPRSAMPSLMGAFTGAGQLSVTADTQRLLIEKEGARLSVRCIEGKYPNFEAVIPKQNKYSVQVSRTTLKMALRRVQLSADYASNLATIRCEGATFVVEASDNEFARTGSESVPVQSDAFMPEGFKIGVKISGMLELIDLLDEDSICLFMSDADKALLLRNESPKLQGKTLLIMPMRLGD